MGKAGKIIMFIIVTVLILGLGATVILMLFRQSKTLDQYIDRQEERYAEDMKQETEFIEDGAVIAKQYTIRSTKNISDTYLAGDPSSLGEEDRKTYDLAKEILESETGGCKTIYEKEKKIFDWMCENIWRDDTDSTRAYRVNDLYPIDTPYGVLSGRHAICVGYATTFRLFMNMLGLECHIPHTDEHSWNEVQLDDGEWYYVDVFFAFQSINENIDYRFFNMDEKMAQDMDKSDCYSHLPKANGRKYLLPVQIGKPIKDIYEIPDRVRKGIDNKESCVSMIFEQELPEKECNLASYTLDSIRTHMEADNSFDKSMDINYCWYRDEEDHQVCAVYLVWSSFDTLVDRDSKEAKKLKKMIDKLFGKAVDIFTPGEEGAGKINTASGDDESDETD